MRQVYVRTVGVLAAEDGVRPGYYRIRFRLPFVHAAERRRRFGLPHGGIPFRRIGRVTRNLLSRQNVLLQPRWLLLLRTATSFARPVLRFLPPPSLFLFFFRGDLYFSMRVDLFEKRVEKIKGLVFLKYQWLGCFLIIFNSRSLYSLCFLLR